MRRRQPLVAFAALVLLSAGCLGAGVAHADTAAGTKLYVDVAAAGWTSAAFVEAALAAGVRTYAVGPGAVRLVWHLDVDDAGTDVAIDVLTALLRCAPTA